MDTRLITLLSQIEWFLAYTGHGKPVGWSIVMAQWNIMKLQGC